METRPGSFARALVNLFDGAAEHFQGLARGLSDWSGFSVDLCYIVMFMVTPAALVMSWAAVATITSAILEAAGALCKAVARRYLRRRAPVVRPDLRIRKP